MHARIARIATMTMSKTYGPRAEAYHTVSYWMSKMHGKCNTSKLTMNNRCVFITDATNPVHGAGAKLIAKKIWSVSRST